MYWCIEWYDSADFDLGGLPRRYYGALIVVVPSVRKLHSRVQNFCFNRFLMSVGILNHAPGE